jgi:hypothetical protein
MSPFEARAPGREAPLGHNDEYAWIDGAAERLLAQSAGMVRDGEQGRVSDRAVAQLMTAAIRLYAAKTDGEERTFRPLEGEGDDEVTATELLTAVSELLRALNLSPMELSIWFRHRPEERGPLE